jgi:peptidoglycan/xylan/chitin deacetylase (PgdA/CDA1 family)
MERFLLLPGKLPESLQLIIGDAERKFSTHNSSDSRKTYDELLPLLRTMTPDVRRNTVRQIFEWSGRIPPRSSHRSMTFDEIKIMGKSSSAVLGAHTHSHQSLAALSKEEQKKEILQSKEILEGLTGKTISHFSYPFGTKRDYNQTTIAICKELGFKWVAANFPDTADITSNHFQIPRFLVRDWKMEEFGMHLKNFFN